MFENKWIKASRDPAGSTQSTVASDQPSAGGALSTANLDWHAAALPQAPYEPGNLLQALLENCPVQIYFKDRESRFVAYSRSFQKLLQLGESVSLRGKTDFDFFAEEHARQAFADEQQILQTGQPVTDKLEKETHTDGRVTWALTTKLPWRDANGNIIGTFGISKNVTAIKDAEAKLAYEQELFQALLDNIPDAIYFKDLQSRFVRASRSTAVKVLPELATADAATIARTLLGRSDADLFSSEHARQALADEQAIIQTGQALVGKLEHESYQDGKRTWCLTTKMPWRDKDGMIVGTFGVSKDITALKEVERKLAYERELFQTLVEHLPDAIFFKDRESRFVKLSHSKVEQARHLLRTKHCDECGPNPPEPMPPHLLDTESCAEFLVGKTDFDLGDPDRALQAWAEEQEILRTGCPVVGKLERATESDGRVTWALTTKMPWHDKDGQIIGTFGVTRDITAVKEAEAQLEETNRRLAHASRMAGMAEVATDVLHNVGNVLNSVNVSCSVVIDKVREGNLDNLIRIPELLRAQAGRLEEFLTSDPRGCQIPAYLTAVARDHAAQRDFVLTELDQLRQHIDHIKQVVAMQQNYAKVSGLCEEIPAAKLMEDAVQINSSALARHQVTVRREFGVVPPLLVDKHKALQILVNLVSNAKYAVGEKATSDRIITLRIAPNGEEHLIMQVVDNGLGIAAENLTRIFAHGFTTRRDGHGFGLHSGALAARELGGELSAHSAGPGCGATFTLRLPLRPPPPATP